MESIKSYIDKSHNLDLVQPDESPNGNTIFHIYSNGEITYQKGGWAYLQRSEFSSSCVSLKKNYNNIFPIKVCGSSISYAIVSNNDAQKIQEMMVEFDKCK